MEYEKTIAEMIGESSKRDFIICRKHFGLSVLSSASVV